MLAKYFGHGNSTHLLLNQDELNELITRFEVMKEKLTNVRQPRVQKFHILNCLHQEIENMEKAVDVVLTDLILIKENLINCKQMSTRLCSVYKTISKGKIPRIWYEKTPEIRCDGFFQIIESKLRHFEDIIRQIRDDVYEVELKMFEEAFSFVKSFLLYHIDGRPNNESSTFVCSAKVSSRVNIYPI